jgi:hypothetical protein
METYLFGKYLAEKPIQVTKTFLNFLYDLEFKTFLFSIRWTLILFELDSF